MSRKIREFRCASNHTEERFVDDNVTAGYCKQCGMANKRIISAVRCKLDPTTGDFPGATMKWIKEKEQAARTKPDS
jgi:hypothetical protein